MSDLHDYRVVVTETVEHVCEVAIDREDVLAWMQEGGYGDNPTLDDITPEVVKDWLEAERDFDVAAFVEEHAYGHERRGDFDIDTVEVFE